MKIFEAFIIKLDPKCIFLLISLAGKNPDKLSHLRYNSEGVGRGLFRSDQFFIQKKAENLRIFLQNVFPELKHSSVFAKGVCYDWGLFVLFLQLFEVSSNAS